MPEEPIRLWEAWRDRGDARAFEELVRPELGRAVALARGEGCPPGEAEDAVQESLARLARETGGEPARVGVRGWFFRIVRDRARARLRADRRRRRREREAAVPEAAPDRASRLDFREEVDRVLDGMPGEDREAVRLRYLLDLEYREVAHVLRISEGACRMRVHRALKRIRRAFGGGAGALLAAVVFPVPARAATWVSSAVGTAPAASGAALSGGTLDKTAAQKAGIAATLAAALGAAVGAGVQSRRSSGEAALAGARAEREAAAAADLRKRLDEAGREREDIRREAEGLRREVQSLREREARLAAEGAAAVAERGRGGADSRSRAEAVERLVAAAREAIGRKDGAAALAAIRRLAGLLPEGRSPAMALVAELADAREGLGTSDVAWGGFLASPEVTDLLGWSLGRPSPEAFREVAAEALPTLLPPETLIARFREALLTEEDEDVQRSMVEGLVSVSSPASTAALTELFGDARVPIPVRVRIATHLSLSETPETLQALRAAAEGAPPALAAGIRTALSAKDVPESGYLVTGFVGGSLESRGLEVGDLLLTYDGRGAAEGLDAAVRNALGRDGFVRVGVLRAGERRTLEVRPGWLGLIGLVLRAPQRR